MESTTGLPKETNGDVTNVQKRANIVVKSAMLVFIQIVLRIFKAIRLQYNEKLLEDLKKQFYLTLRFIFFFFFGPGTIRTYLFEFLNVK